MDIYILDESLRREQVVDKFESMIWTERWMAYGEFELEVQSSLENRGRFQVGTMLAINNSYRVMMVETVEDHLHDDGILMLHVQGRSLEGMLVERVAFSGEPVLPVWSMNGTPRNIAIYMFTEICMPGSATIARDLIPFMKPGNIHDLGNIPEYSESIVWDQEPDSLYNAIQSLCKTYDLGFRIVRNFDESELYFEIYSGSDRTTSQTTLPAVVFSPSMDNIQNTRELHTVQQAKNVAYVFSEQGNATVYAPGVDQLIEGFERRVMVVKAQVEEEETDVNGVLVKEGLKALRDVQPQRLFDGEVNPRTSFVYGVDYEVGDLVEVRNRDGNRTFSRVSEQVFVADTQGERSFPTLAFETLTSENVWLDYANQATVWEDFNTEVWEDM
jgi:hypothetical protein